MKINREFYLDKVHACWTGKNIGGTMGAPYEGKTEMQDIPGFVTKKGELIPNDDLDLQLIWLCAVEERGIQNITPQLLGEYWLSYIVPHWNEYGIGKANMRMGILPPYSGEYNNELWKNSNGAWIRTEIWACLFPGFPELAVKYAYNDACVDHGMGEGTYAAMFVAALESAAFFENDIRKLIETGLSYIPKSSRVAQSAELAIAMYDKKADFRQARDAIVENSKDLGSFQAPANVAFVILGLLYGEGDYKKSMIHAINCGDDTDCTGATIGSIMGIMNGSKGVPSDWAEYIGDKIESIAVDLSYIHRPKSCTELTRRIYELVPSALKAYGIFAEYTDGETVREDIPATYREDRSTHTVMPGAERVPGFGMAENGLSIYFPDMIYAKALVELDKYRIEPGEEIKLKFSFKNTSPDPKQIIIDLRLPEGWTKDKESTSVYLHEARFFKKADAVITVTAGENVCAINRLFAVLSVNNRPTISAAQIILEGK